MTETSNQQVVRHAKTHKAEIWTIYFIVALWFVWSQAANIHDFYTGFVEGFAAAM